MQVLLEAHLLLQQMVKVAALLDTLRVEIWGIISVIFDFIISLFIPSLSFLTVST